MSGFLGAKDDGGGGELQSNRHHQQTNTRLFTGPMSFSSPNQQFRITEGKSDFFLWKKYADKSFICVLADVSPTQREKMSATLSGQNVGLIFVADKRASVKSALVLGWVTAFGQVNHLAT